MNTYSDEHKIYLKKLKKEKILINFFKIFIVLFLLFIWEFLARTNVINTFLTSSPSKIFVTIIDLFKNYNLTSHIIVTSYETIFSFTDYFTFFPFPSLSSLPSFLFPLRYEKYEGIRVTIELNSITRVKGNWWEKSDHPIITETGGKVVGYNL